jgi:hypothetical protein
MHVLVCIALLLAVYCVVAHWMVWLQGGSLGPAIVGVVAFIASVPALGWPLALLAFVVDPGCLLYAVLVIRLYRDSQRRGSSC